MKSALKFSELWKIVEQEIDSFPVDLSIKETVAKEQADDFIRNRVVTSGPIQDQVRAYQTEMSVWEDLNNQASELIYNKCEDKPAENIEDEQFATNRWVRLQTDYFDSGFVLRFSKLQNLWGTTMTNSSNSIKTYVVNIRIRAKDLKRMGVAIDEWILIALLLMNLNGKFS